MWDEDVTPRASPRTQLTVGSGTALFANLGQFVLDEDASGSLDRPVVIRPADRRRGGADEGRQDDVGCGVLQLRQHSKWRVRTRVCLPATPVPVLITPTNPAGPCADSTKTNNLDRLLNDYNVLDVTALIALKLGSLPLSVMGDYVLNTADPKDAAGNETKDSGYQAGLILGKASDPSTWEAAYFCKLMGTDATVADVADADFGDGGTDRKGHIVWVAYNTGAYAKVKFFRQSDWTRRRPKTTSIGYRRISWSNSEDMMGRRDAMGLRHGGHGRLARSDGDRAHGRRR
jgi:hypothetical protein